MIEHVYVTTMQGPDGRLGRFAWFDPCPQLRVWVRLFGCGKLDRQRVELTADHWSRGEHKCGVLLSQDWQLIYAAAPAGPFAPPLELQQRKADAAAAAARG